MEYYQKILYFFLAVIRCGDFTAVDYRGTEFLITFTRNLYKTGDLYILLTAQHDSNVTIQNNMAATSNDYFVSGGSSVQIKLPDTNLMYLSDLDIERKSLYIVSTSLINVYTLNYYIKSTDGYHAIPIKALSTEYIIVSYPVSEGWIVIAAVEDTTVVKINFKLAGTGTCSDSLLENGFEKTYELNRFDVIGTACTSDFTGSVVTSNKPVTVLVGHKCAPVPETDGTCDKLEEMMPPTETFGTTFVLHDLAGRDTGTIYRIVAKDNGTTVHSSTGQEYPLDRGDFVELDTFVSGQLCVTSTRPVLVALLAKGKNAGGAEAIGDPFLSRVPSVKQYISTIVTNYQWDTLSSVKYYVTVVVHKDYAVSLGKNFTFVNISSCDYVVATIEQKSKSLTINSDNSVPIGVMTYGLGVDDVLGFGYPVAMALDIDDCLSNPCQNNGACQDSVYSYSCVCGSGFTGVFCETELAVEESSTLADQFSTEGTMIYAGESLQTYIISSTPDIPSSLGITFSTLEFNMLPTSVTNPLYMTSQTDISFPLDDVIISHSSDVLQTLELSDSNIHGDSSFLFTESVYSTEQTMLHVSPVSQSANTVMPTDIYISVASVTPQGVSVSASADISETQQQTLLSPSTTSTVSVISVCTCSCRGHSSQTSDSVSEITEQIRQNLTVDTTTLGKTIRKYTSVHDDRPSAQAVGAMGLVVVSIAVVFIVSSDVLSIFTHIHRICFKRLSIHNSPTEKKM